MKPSEYAALAHAIAKSMCDGSDVISNMATNLKFDAERFKSYINHAKEDYRIEEKPTTKGGADAV